MLLSMDLPKPARLAGREYQKIWGATELEPWFENSSRKIGEVWFTEDEWPVLIKFLFTTENLSVQVHPDDAQARAEGCARGKTEMWHILRAEPGACIALGLRGPATQDEVRRASLDGSIMEMLRWIPARPGDTWFVPAGAIHAIGAGIALCEIQQHSDITYRLYDYGRARELHLDRGMAVADLTFRADAIGPPDLPGQVTELVRCSHFEVEEIRVRDRYSLEARPGKRNALIALEGVGTMAGEGFRAGEVWMLPPDLRGLELAGDARLLQVAG